MTLFKTREAEFQSTRADPLRTSLLVSNVWEWCDMKKWVALLALAGAGWMTVVLYSGSLFVATISNYPGVFAARWVQYRGIAPSSAIVWVSKFGLF
jgi:hypothetical protein